MITVFVNCFKVFLFMFEITVITESGGGSGLFLGQSPNKGVILVTNAVCKNVT